MSENSSQTNGFVISKSFYLDPLGEPCMTIMKFHRLHYFLELSTPIYKNLCDHIFTTGTRDVTDGTIHFSVHGQQFSITPAVVSACYNIQNDEHLNAHIWNDSINYESLYNKYLLFQGKIKYSGSDPYVKDSLLPFHQMVADIMLKCLLGNTRNSDFLTPTQLKTLLCLVTPIPLANWCSVLLFNFNLLNDQNPYKLKSPKHRVSPCLYRFMSGILFSISE